MSDERPPGPESPETRPPSPEQAPPPSPYMQPPPVPGPPVYQANRPYEPGRPVPIREMRVGELLDAAIKLYRANWKTVMGIAAYIVVPLAFIQSFLTRENLGGLGDVLRGIEPSTTEPSTTALVATLVFGLLQVFFIVPFLTAAFTKVTTDLYGGGRPEVTETYRYALGKTKSILWVVFLTGLAALGGFILLIIPGIIFLIRFSFSTVVVVSENLKGTDAMRRSWRLAKGFFWKIFGTLFLARILTGIVAALVGLVPTIAANYIGPSAWPLAALGNSLGTVVTTPFLVIIVVLLYFDLRIRKEGLDLALLVDEMGSETPGT